MSSLSVSRPNNLPLHLTSFIGRKREIAAVKHLLAGTRLLTITGTGGCGKTRLALQAAAELLPDYADGVWIADLAALSDATLVPQTVAAALDVPEHPGRSLTDSLVNALRSKTLLLVLDNCEHLLAACGELAGTLLQECPGVRILATSRAKLGIAGELPYRVPSLSLPQPDHPPALEDLKRFEASCLFVERAASNHPEFRITRENVSAVAEVCRRLDGIPLAIELAAARAPVLTVEQIAARLDDRFGLLTGGNQAALPRHQTLRATMDWSHDQLSDKERMLLRRLSVFAGGCTLGAIEAICAGGDLDLPDILNLLTQLVDKSLVQAETREDEARYTLLETVRQYARERIEEAGETAECRARHRAWYLMLAQRAGPELRGPHQLTWIARLEENHDNLLAALDWCRAEAGDTAAGLDLAAALYDFWDVHGHFTEGRAWFDQMLSLNQAAPPELRTQALTRAAHLAHRQGDYGRVTALCGEALALARAGGDKKGQAEALHYLAHVAENAGDHRRARALLERSVALQRAVRSTWELARASNCLANAIRFGGDYPRAAALFEEALALFQAVHDRIGRGTGLYNLAYVELRQGNPERARARFLESLALAQELGDKRAIIKCLEGLAAASAEATPQWAAKLLGAVTALMSAAGVSVEPVNRRDLDHYVALTANRLGTAAFDAARARGAAMSLEEAMAYALAAEKTAAPARAENSKLTARERMVAVLVAQGLTNRRIASNLFIAERTADAHVEHILTKLGVNSRAQIAAWAVEQGLFKAPTD